MDSSLHRAAQIHLHTAYRMLKRGKKVLRSRSVPVLRVTEQEPHLPAVRTPPHSCFLQGFLCRGRLCLQTEESSEIHVISLGVHCYSLCAKLYGFILLLAALPPPRFLGVFHFHGSYTIATLVDRRKCTFLLCISRLAKAQLPGSPSSSLWCTDAEGASLWLSHSSCPPLHRTLPTHTAQSIWRKCSERFCR